MATGDARDAASAAEAGAIPERKLEPYQGGYADVRAYGAKGDGVTDDTDAIQRAVDAPVGLVYFPRGDYRISRSIQVALAERGRTAIRGASARLVHYGEGPALRFLGTHRQGTARLTHLTPDVAQRQLSPLLADIEIMGAHEAADGVFMDGTHMLTIENAFIRTCRYGIHAVRHNRNLIVTGAKVFACHGIGIFLEEVDFHQVNVVGCHISYNRQGGIKVVGGNVRNLQITGNDIEYNTGGPDSDACDVWLIAGQRGIREGTIASNTIQALPSRRGANVRLEGFPAEGDRKVGLFAISGNLITNQAYNVHLRHCRGVTISANTVQSHGLAPDAGGGHERNFLIEDSSQIAITDNIADQHVDYRARIVGGIEVARSSGITIADNVLYEGYGGDAERGATLEVRDSWGVNVTGCTLIDSEFRGIAFHNVRDSRISDCLVLEERAEKRMVDGILEDDSCHANVITANRVHPGARDAIRSHGAGTLVGHNLTAPLPA